MTSTALYYAGYVGTCGRLLMALSFYGDAALRGKVAEFDRDTLLERVREFAETMTPSQASLSGGDWGDVDNTTLLHQITAYIGLAVYHHVGEWNEDEVDSPDARGRKLHGMLMEYVGRVKGATE